MARFNALLQSLARPPAFQQGLFDAAKGIGATPVMLTEQRKLEQERQDRDAFSEELLAAAGDPNKIGNVLTAYGAKFDDPELAIRGASMLSAAKETERTQEGQGALAYLQDQMRQTLQTELTDNFTAQDQQRKLNDLQASANAIARNVRGLDPLAAASMSMNMENAVFQQKSARNQERRAEEALEIRFEGHEMALEKHKEYMATADYRQQIRDFDVNSKKYDAAIAAAKGAPQTEEAKAAFLQRYPEMEGVWDSVTTQKESQRLQLEQIKAAAEDNKFDYTDEELFDLLGIPGDQRGDDSAEGQANLKAIKRLRALPPKRANVVLQAAVESSFAKTKAPPAALVGLFKDAAMAYTAGQFGVSDEEEEGQAAQLALKAAQAYMQAGSGVGAFQAALEVMAIEAGKVSGSSESSDIKELRQMQTQYID